MRVSRVQVQLPSIQTNLTKVFSYARDNWIEGGGHQKFVLNAITIHRERSSSSRPSVLGCLILTCCRVCLWGNRRMESSGVMHQLIPAREVVRLRSLAHPRHRDISQIKSYLSLFRCFRIEIHQNLEINTKLAKIKAAKQLHIATYQNTTTTINETKPSTTVQNSNTTQNKQYI